ncbi:MAG: OmpH family outer membrane protein [Steroidobacteraceae bacterium]|nr:OmpH family outer membrane protein [Steroidobacteraceae bacterium]MDW8260056.1 OmpH family outer membrane protein [Gammaproteobacteria bacterium]
MNSSIWFRSAALAALLGSAAPALAQVKIGVVDFGRLQQEAPQAKAALEALRSEFAPKQKDLETRIAAQKARVERFQKDQATMSPEQRSRLEKEVRDEEREIQRRQGEYTDDFNARRNEELSKLTRILLEEVRNYARAQNYDLVLSEASVAYATATTDITSAILGALTARAALSGAANRPPAAPAATPASTPRPTPRN